VNRPTRGWTPTRLRRSLLALVVVVIGVLVGTANPASAHAVLVSATPVAGERLVTSPPEVSMTFSEGVSIDLGGLEVLDSSGERVDTGDVDQPSAEQLRVPLEPDLPDGTYLATYRIVSGDGHPITGTVVFAIGDVLDAASVSGLEQAEQPLARTLGDVARFLTYVGTLLLVGLAVFLAFLADDGPERPRIVHIAQRSSLVSVGGIVLVVVAQASLATGLGLGAFASDGVLADVLAQGGLGWSIVVLLVGISLVLAALATNGTSLGHSLALYGGLLACGSFLLWGHTNELEPRVLVQTADALHVSVAAVWLGGLVGLGVVLRNRSTTVVEETMPAPVDEGVDPDLDAVVIDTAGVVIRFSTAAAVSVALLAATGTVLAWKTVGSLDNLLTTPYGRTLTAKLVVVGVVLALAAWNRYRLVPHLLTEVVANDEARLAAVDAPPGSVAVAPPAVCAPRWDRLTSAIRFEVIGLLVVLALTAVLVYQVPANADDAAGDGPYATRLTVDDGLQVDLIVAPATAGPNSFHLTYVDTVGAPIDTPESVTLRLRLPEAGVGPIEVPAPKGGVGHFFVVTDAMAIPGDWDVELLTKLDEFTVLRTDLTVPIGEP